MFTSVFEKIRNFQTQETVESFPISRRNFIELTGKIFVKS